MRFIISIITVLSCINCYSQCSSSVSNFPYREGFELNDGGWTSGGSGNDWAWGSASKPVINAAGEGSKCWIVGGLTTGPYTDGEASFLQSPCFDFSILSYPYIECRIFWEMEQRFDGASFQYSLDNGGNWITVGSTNDPSDCLNANWFNYSPITYLSSLSSSREGWSGNKQVTSGSCRGGNGSNGWVLAKHTMPYLAGKPSVIFRFVFGAGTICNNYDGFAVDDITIADAPPNNASYNFTCVDSHTVQFNNTSALCPTTTAWDFDDPASGTDNLSNLSSPVHRFSGPGEYRVKLFVNGPGNAPSTIIKTITIIDLQVQSLSNADCQTNSGGSLSVTVRGGTGPYNYSWNSNPIQQTPIAVDLGVGNYQVTVSGSDLCPNTASGRVDPDAACTGVYFPSAFTPNRDGRNDQFGPLGSLAALTNYRLSIYNRWGQKIFSSTDPYIKWDGTVQGQVTDSNLFTWQAEFSLLGKPKEFRKGVVLLIR